MIRTVSINNFTHASGSRAAAAFQAVRSQPGWITRLALLTILIVIALPIAFLLMLALLAGALVFAVLAVMNMLTARFRRAMPRHDGRQNVRVIRRAEEVAD